MFVLLVGLVFSGYKIVDYFYTSYDEKQNFNNVEKLVESEYEMRRFNIMILKY